MKSLRILFDTNVILDFIVDRKPFSDEAEKAIELCMEKGFGCYIAAHTVPNLFYILRNHLSLGKRREILLEICKMFIVVAIDSGKLVSSLSDGGFADFEDCLQHECAREINADYILTRNVADFSSSAIPVIEPKSLMEKLQHAASWADQATRDR